MPRTDLPVGVELDAAVHAALGHKWDETRCRVCGWKLSTRPELGCVDDWCSFRPSKALQHHDRADTPPHYSTDLACAMRALRETGMGWVATFHEPNDSPDHPDVGSGLYEVAIRDFDDKEWPQEYAASLERAICRAILAWKEVQDAT